MSERAWLTVEPSPRPGHIRVTAHDMGEDDTHRDLTGDEARALSLELARTANNVDPPKEIEPRTHHYAARLDTDGVTVHVYEEADGLPTLGMRPTGALTLLAASNCELNLHAVRRIAQSRFQFVEMHVHRRDGRIDKKIG